MAQILCFGASSAYGVGSVNGGWADRTKRLLHEEMYGIGTRDAEAHQVYNLCISGETLNYLEKRVAQEILPRQKENRQNIVIFEVGGNDSRADGAPDAYVSTPEQLRSNLEELLKPTKPHAAKIMFIGLTPCDESKTSPKINPWTKRPSYFTNERRRLMEDVVAGFCNDHELTFVAIHEAAQSADWQKKYVAADGLHPNEAGHAWIFEHVKPVLIQFLDGVV